MRGIDFRFIGFCLGFVSTAIGIFMLVPAIIDYIYDDKANAYAFLGCASISFFIGIMLTITCNHPNPRTGLHEGFLMTTLCWLAACLLSALPFHFTDINLSFADSFFESASGITTTGATIITGLDSKSPGILLWRSLTHWFGGIGIIALAIIFLPFLRVGGMQLFRTESSDKSEKIMPRADKVMKAIVTTYVFLTIIAAITFRFLGMGNFDAINHAMSVMATGGFSTHDASIGYFKSSSIEWAVSVFMIIGALPVILFTKILFKKSIEIFKDGQVRTYIIFVLSSATIIALWHSLNSGIELNEALRHSIFSVASITSTTGMASTDYTSWGPFSVMAFLFLTYIGGCTGSTSGGIKMMRLQIVARQGVIQLKKLVHPHGVFNLTYQGKTVSQPDVQSVMVFLILYVLTNLVITLLLTAGGIDFATAISGAATSIANAGPGVGHIIGPVGNYTPLSDYAKIVLGIAMILGRLEILTVLVIFHPSFWKR